MRGICNKSGHTCAPFNLYHGSRVSSFNERPRPHTSRWNGSPVSSISASRTAAPCPSLRRVQERPDPLHAHQRDDLDEWRLRAAYFCLGCDLGCIWSGICCGALLERANTVYLPGKEDCRHLCGAQSTFFYLRFSRSRAVSMTCLCT